MSQSDQIKKNIEESHKASQKSRFQQSGLTDERTKLSSKNFDKLMSQRDLSKQDSEQLKKSFDQKAGMQTRHAKQGEKFVTTHGTESSSGVFVSKESLGNTPQERQNKGALPHNNPATYETKVELGRDQNLIEGKIAPQSKFSKMDPKQTPRQGGGEQVVTDGGYKSGAVINKDTKFPTTANDSFMKKANEHKQSNGNDTKKTHSQQNNTNRKGQSM